jgi:indole-3-glycerol phosphate synthase
MPDILTEIVSATRASLPRRKAAHPVSSLRSSPLYGRGRRGFASALSSPPLALIGEHKRRSPSRGVIREDLSLADVVSAYQTGGARAISVLTEPDYFGGSLTDLSGARASTALPLLRKDFIVEPYQVVEARAHGADAILLIAAALDRSALGDLFDAAREEGLEALVEVHTSAELERLDLNTMKLVGVNNRDLRTFEVDLQTSATIFPLLPNHTIRVSESGYLTTQDILFAAEIGAHAVLAGERLMSALDPEALVSAWINAVSKVDQAS